MTSPPISPGPAEPYTLAAIMPAPAGKPPRPGWVVPVFAAMGVLVLVLGGVAAWALTRGIDDPAVAPASSTFNINGLLFLNGRAVLNIDNVTCSGLNTTGYDDIHTGTSVTVTDAEGAVIGLGSLRAGTMTGSGATRICTFPFLVENVVAGKGFYGIEVSHRGKVNFSEADLKALATQISLGP